MRHRKEYYLCVLDDGSTPRRPASLKLLLLSNFSWNVFSLVYFTLFSWLNKGESNTKARYKFLQKLGKSCCKI